MYLSWVYDAGNKHEEDPMKVAFAHKANEPEYTEVLLTEVEERIPAATEWAKANGYVVRIAEINLDTPPTFGRNVIN
jgi:hypothetical protein